jgi:hypothetical protein
MRHVPQHSWLKTSVLSSPMLCTPPTALLVRFERRVHPEVDSGLGLLMRICGHSVAAKRVPYVLLVTALSISLTCERSKAQQPRDDVRYPDDSGVVNVRTQYGAVGDGITDDTAALTRAIGDNRGIFQRILYFPSGTYIVSDTLYGKAQDGTWRARLTFQGENRNTTIIRLKDNLPEFQDPRSPKAVIQTGSIQPYSKQTGAGNNGFRNYIFNLAVDTGRGNPGAIGIDYLGNNLCGIESVTIRTEDSQRSGVAGLLMRRSYVGPCLYKSVEIDGFDYGVLSAGTEYSQTFEHLRLSGQRIAGIINSGNVLSIQDLDSVNSVPAIINDDPKGLVTLIDTRLQGPKSSSAAILNSGALLLRNISVAGYSTTIQGKDGSNLDGNVIEFVSAASVPAGLAGQAAGRSSPGHLTLNLQVQETPELGSYDLSKWMNVESSGAIPDGKTDCTKGIQKALDSGANVVYFPAGNYRVTDTIHIRGKTQKILGLGAVILPDGPRFANESSPVPLIRFESVTSDVSIDSMQFGWWTRKNYPGTVWLENASTRALVLEHVDFEGVATLVYRAQSGREGPVFIEDVEGFKWLFDGPQHIWARQFDVEGAVDASKVSNNGAFLWILGLKTEGPQTAIDTKNGGSTELLGGLLFPVRAVGPDVPAFIVSKASISMTYAVSAYKPENNYQIQIQTLREAGTENIKNSDLPKRGYGSLATTPIIALENQ